jgi:cysteine-rich repeat protein
MRQFIFLHFTGLLLGTSACTFNFSTPEGASETSETGAPTDPTPTEPGTVASTGTSGSPSGETTLDEPTTATSGDETTPAAPMCGNGVVEEGEMCDDLLENLGDEKACSATCQQAKCGDGHVQVANAEICDHGPLNVLSPGYDQCSSLTCLPGPYCGDGEVQPEHGEDCELEGQGESENCSVTCTYKTRFIFLTSSPHDGNFGGVAGADAWCNELVADSPGLTGTFRAWLLVDGQALADRFPEFTALQPAWRFRNVAGDVLAKSFDELIAAGPVHPIIYSEAGDLLAEKFVWTNVTNSGQAAGGDCGQWTGSAELSALVGHSGYHPDEGPDAAQWHAKRWWTDADDLVFPCKNAAPRLYCVQVAD